MTLSGSDLVTHFAHLILRIPVIMFSITRMALMVMLSCPIQILFLTTMSTSILKCCYLRMENTCELHVVSVEPRILMAM